LYTGLDAYYYYKSFMFNCHCFSISTARASDVKYMLTTGTAAVDKFSSYAIVIASLELPAGFDVKPGM